MDLVEEIGGEAGIRAMLSAFHTRINEDNETARAVETDLMAARTDNQCQCVAHFISGDADKAHAEMADAHAFVVGRGMDDDAFDAIYDHYHDSLAEMGIPGGMVHLFLEAFEDLRDSAMA